ncbi:RHS repeat-associated core domain-containing protein, partial [Pseudomonas sp. RL_5y_Pfl2_73]|uniref:RHS repeat-associated core domain-containing protein n=1 Tax=Pseudomonas sp. RL_5y_Pfl2_73 TaxID=3088713 RepID=UPI0030DC62FB
ETAKRADIRNSLRFQGQYFDVETGLHYNRYRYYDPQVGRFIGKDPIGFSGGLNVYAYAPNPANWIDPLGLSITLAERLANKAQNLPASKRPNTVAAITSTDGRITIGKNQGGVINSEVQNALDGITPNEFSAQCAEVNAIARARNKGIDLKGATISVANVRGKKSSSGVHGTSKPPCSVCNPLLNKFDMNLLERCNKNG